jgi:aryl-alcohol dehydrogenase-like predicted oxidoreductase
MASLKTPPSLVFGTADWTSDATNLKRQEEFVSILRKHDILAIDTARAYVR